MPSDVCVFACLCVLTEFHPATHGNLQATHDIHTNTHTHKHRMAIPWQYFLLHPSLARLSARLSVSPAAASRSLADIQAAVVDEAALRRTDGGRGTEGGWRLSPPPSAIGSKSTTIGQRERWRDGRIGFNGSMSKSQILIR